ncbi:uncharacterized protein LOC133818035 isoform X2 [Humulus lupulus]|uniref:uncharacterized protein LOC133818035 isoform X2 n=1 Tax=Humulus lupulus TaxID=3486 RepID=UPI002B40505C|nr:uncharacterized protein LOC133818035 isoform X2 [Humulus lupulus]
MTILRIGKDNKKRRASLKYQLGGDDLLHDSPIHKRKTSLRKLAAPATRVVIDSPPALSTRATTRRMILIDSPEVIETTLDQSITNSPIASQQKVDTCRKSTRLQNTSTTFQVEFEATPQDHNANEELEMITKKTRGRTILANLTRRNGELIKINWNMNGQPIGDNSIQFASFVGTLVREIVPYTLSDWRKMTPIMRDVLWASIQAKYDLHQDWEKKYCFQMMVDLWRASKSRLVKDIISAKTESERQALKPDCIKSDVEWRAFIKQKTSKEHMTKQNQGGNITRVQTFQKAHTRKNGEPINSTTSEFLGQLDDIIRENPNSETTKNIEEDALTILFGEPKSSRQIGQGRGMSKSKSTIVHMYQDKIEVLEKEQHNMKKQLAELLKLFKENGGKVSTSDGKSHITHSPKPSSSSLNHCDKSVVHEESHNFSDMNSACYLLDWKGEMVAEDRWSSSDPNTLVHGIPLGPEFMRVWVDIAISPSAYLFRPSHSMITIQEAVGSIIAWPSEKVVPRCHFNDRAYC